MKKQRTCPTTLCNVECQTPSSPISLTRVRGISDTWNEGCFGLSLKELVKGEMENVIISNYMVDFGWMLSAYPDLKNCQRLLVLHGEKDATQIRNFAKESDMAQVEDFAPPLPIPFGTHHSKFFLITFKNNGGLRLIIHTANMIYQDCNNKTQGAWYQDFPLKQQNPQNQQASNSSSYYPDVSKVASNSLQNLDCDFERDLLQYFKKLNLKKEQWIWVEGIIKAHDFQFARGSLVASVPGYHSGDKLEEYGHMRVAKLLSKEVFDDKFAGGPLICQFSSLGSLDKNWMFGEFLSSLSSGKCGPNKSPLGVPVGKKLALVWPTVEEVRNSLEGWKAGYSIPGNTKNVSKPFLQELWHRFDGSKVGRQRAMPHIKTFVRYQGEYVCWCILGSHNLSKAAWGTLQKNNTQIMIRSYELGVLITPQSELRYLNSNQYGFMCNTSGEDAQTESQQFNGQNEPVKKSISEVEFKAFSGKTVTLDNNNNDEENQQQELSSNNYEIQIPLPYCVPPIPYESVDVPWKVDGIYDGMIDIFGEEYGAPAKFYGNTE